MASDDDLIPEDPCDYVTPTDDGGLAVTHDENPEEVSQDLDLLANTRRELAAAREEIERFQYFSCQLQEDHQEKLNQLHETNNALSEKLKSCLEEKDALTATLTSFAASARPPTMTELRDRKDCTPKAIIVHEKEPFALVDKINPRGGVTRRVWSIAQDIPGARLGNKICDGDEWGAFRGEDDVVVLNVPVFISMPKAQIVDFEEQLLEFNRQRLLLEQTSAQCAHGTGESRIKVLVRDADDTDLKNEVSVLRKEVSVLRAARKMWESSAINARESEIQSPPQSVPDEVSSSQLGELSRKLEMVESQLMKSESRGRQLEQELNDLISRQQSNACCEPRTVVSIPTHLPASEPPTASDPVASELKLCQRNEELEAEVKKLAEEVASDNDKYRTLQLRQSVIYMLSQIPENYEVELELTIQTVIGLLGLEREARERLAIKRTRLQRGWR